MRKYFVQFNGSGCTLSVEKHLYSFIREKYDHTLVAENFIPTMVADLEREQRSYFMEHRGSPVAISSHPSGVENNHFVTAGNVCVVLIEVRREF